MDFNGMQGVVVLRFLNNKLCVLEKVTRTSVVPMQVGKYHGLDFITGYTNLPKCAIDPLIRLLNIRAVGLSGRNKASFRDKSASVKQNFVFSVRD